MLKYLALWSGYVKVGPCHGFRREKSNSFFSLQVKENIILKWVLKRQFIGSYNSRLIDLYWWYKQCMQEPRPSFSGFNLSSYPFQICLTWLQDSNSKAYIYTTLNPLTKVQTKNVHWSLIVSLLLFLGHMAHPWTNCWSPVAGSNFLTTKLCAYGKHRSWE